MWGTLIGFGLGLLISWPLSGAFDPSNPWALFAPWGSWMLLVIVGMGFDVWRDRG